MHIWLCISGLDKIERIKYEVNTQSEALTLLLLFLFFLVIWFRLGLKAKVRHEKRIFGNYCYYKGASGIVQIFRKPQ